jgi:hypothetical protein
MAAIIYSSYFETRKRLLLQARVDVVRCVQIAQASVRLLLVSEGAQAELLRLVSADIVETLLCRASLAITQDVQYTELSTTEARAQFLEGHLKFALLVWLLPQAREDRDAASLKASLTALDPSNYR